MPMDRPMAVIMMQNNPAQCRCLLFFNARVTDVFDPYGPHYDKYSYEAVEVVHGVIFPIDSETHDRILLEPLAGSVSKAEDHDPLAQVGKLIEYVYDHDLAEPLK